MDIREGNFLDVRIPQVQMIYLDPPFNSSRDYKMEATGGAGFSDKWTDADYKQFVENTVDKCKDHLATDGSLFFHISFDQMFIPECVLRERFKFVKPIFWKRCRSKNNIKNSLGASIDVIFWCYQTPKRKFHMVYQEKDATYKANSFKNADERGNFALGHLVCDKSMTGHDYEFIIDGKTFRPPRGWRIKKQDLEALAADNRLYVPKQSKSNLYKKIYLHENPGKPAMDLWDDIPSIAQGSEERKYPTAKPVKLLQRMIEMTTDEGDLVLDPMAGSGTTGEACSKLKRRCILIDQNPDAIITMRERLALLVATD